MKDVSMPDPAATAFSSRDRRVRLFLFFFVLLFLVLTSGGRLVSSDEVSMYLTIETLVRHGSLSIPAGSPNSSPVGDNTYSWYEVGNTLTGIPLYLVGILFAKLLPLSPTFQALLPKASVSLTGAFVGAFLAGSFFSLCRRSGMNTRPAILYSLLVIAGTFLLPYFKLFMKESVLALCLTASFSHIASARNSDSIRSLALAGLYAGFGILTKLTFVLNFGILLLFVFLGSREKSIHMNEKIRRSLAFSLPAILLGIGGCAIYNFIRFGNPLISGYPDAVQFTTPLYVGAFGLLLSPGKGLAWFAPALLLLPAALIGLRKSHRSSVATILGIFLVNFFLYATYVAWGGDGSWGPRYLAPIVPLLVFLVVLYVDRAGRSIKLLLLFLSLAGAVGQIGGSSIYAGSYLREIGEFPYQRDFSDREFLYKSHFIPDYSPLIGHWRMATRNLAQHLGGDIPRIRIADSPSDGRLPVSRDDQEKLTLMLDFWFTYAMYSGISAKVLIFSLSLLAIALAGSAALLWKESRMTVPDIT